MIKTIFKGLGVFAIAGLLSLSACTTEQDNSGTSVKASQAPVSQEYAGTKAVKANAAGTETAAATESEFEPSQPASATPKKSRWSFSERVSNNTVMSEDADSESYIPYILIALLVIVVAIFYIRKSK